MRIAFRTVATVVAIVLAVLLVGPQQLGGPVATVSTYGDSMLPTYEENHLVAVRRAADYGIGDIVAYRSDTLDTVVLHRIVGSDADGFVTQGDNNDWLDPDRPTADDFIGRAWFAVPRIGPLLELPGPARALLPFVILLGVAAATRGKPAPGATRERGDRRRRSPRHRPPPRTGTTHWTGRPAQVMAAAGVAVVAGGILAVASWTRPTSVPGTVPYEHHGRFAYTADVRPGAVYPDGTIDPGEPVFLRIADRLDVTFGWRLETTADADVGGTGRLVAEIADGSGWRGSLPVGEPVAWTGRETTLTGVLDLAAVRRLAARVADQTGLAASNQTVTLTAELDVAGDLAGAPLVSRITPGITFQVDGLRAVATGADREAPDVLAVTEPGTVTAPAVEAATFAVAGRSVPVAVVRPAAIVLVVAGIVAAAVAAVLASRRRHWDAHRRIADRHRHLVLEVAGLSGRGDRSLVAVTGIDQLADLATQLELPVLRVPMAAGGFGYVVDDVRARYQYLLPDEPPAPVPTAPTAPTSAETARPAPRAAPAPGTDERLWPRMPEATPSQPLAVASGFTARAPR